MLILLLALSAPAHADSLETQILTALNQLRVSPKTFLPDLRRLEKSFRGKTLPLEKNVVVRTNEGKPAVLEAVRFVENAKPAPTLALSQALGHAARDHVADQSKSGATGHVGGDGTKTDGRIAKYGVWRGGVGENISYGWYAGKDGRAVVTALLVDDGVPGRGHRENLFNPDYSRVGIACGSHPKFPSVCVIDFANRMQEK